MDPDSHISLTAKDEEGGEFMKAHVPKDPVKLNSAAHQKWEIAAKSTDILTLSIYKLFRSADVE